MDFNNIRSRMHLNKTSYLILSRNEVKFIKGSFISLFAFFFALSSFLPNKRFGVCSEQSFTLQNNPTLL